MVTLPRQKVAEPPDLSCVPTILEDRDTRIKYAGPGHPESPGHVRRGTFIARCGMNPRISTLQLSATHSVSHITSWRILYEHLFIHIISSAFTGPKCLWTFKYVWIHLEHWFSNANPHPKSFYNKGSMILVKICFLLGIFEWVRQSMALRVQVYIARGWEHFKIF